VATGTELVALICGVIAGVQETADCRPGDRLADLGVDSVRAAEAAAVLQDALGLEVPMETVLTAATPQHVADALLTRWLADGSGPDLVRDRMVLAVGTVSAVNRGPADDAVGVA
jgi:acyl carrier protein